MKVAVGSDHAGFELKQKVKEYLAETGIEVEDVGTVSTESVDYPDFAEKVALEVREGRADRGILMCGTGVGVCIAANKYAEGYPGKRYYGCCEFVDVVEELARERAKKLFGAEHANVQPHSGTQANVAVYMTVCKPGDTILGMSLAHGGHLTHGHPLNFSGRLYNVVAYGVRKEDERIDYDALLALAKQHRPKVIVVGASAYPRTIDFVAVRRAADESGAVIMADIAHIAGLITAGLHPSPIPHAEFVTSTTQQTIRGPRGGLVMCQEQWAK